MVMGSLHSNRTHTKPIPKIMLLGFFSTFINLRVLVCAAEQGIQYPLLQKCLENLQYQKAKDLGSFAPGTQNFPLHIIPG